MKGLAELHARAAEAHVALGKAAGARMEACRTMADSCEDGEMKNCFKAMGDSYASDLETHTAEGERHVAACKAASSEMDKIADDGVKNIIPSDVPKNVVLKTRAIPRYGAPQIDDAGVDESFKKFLTVEE